MTNTKVGMYEGMNLGQALEKLCMHANAMQNLHDSSEWGKAAEDAYENAKKEFSFAFDLTLKAKSRK
jgi:hypothetical protein